MFLFDPMYFIFILPALLLAGWAQAKVSSAFQTYSRVRSSRGLTGGEVAQRILRHSGLHDVAVERTDRQLGDHYDPRKRVVRLSPTVADGASLAALGVAAHEVGHALQHDKGYLWLGIRNTIIPVTQFGSQMAFPLFFMGLFFRWSLLIDLGIAFFAFAVLFQLITLPVEFDASRRAMYILESGGYISREERGPVRAVLSAAALTYVAAAFMAIMQLVYLLTLARRRD